MTFSGWILALCLLTLKGNAESLDDYSFWSWNVLFMYGCQKIVIYVQYSQCFLLSHLFSYCNLLFVFVDLFEEVYLHAISYNFVCRCLKLNALHTDRYLLIDFTHFLGIQSIIILKLYLKLANMLYVRFWDFHTSMTWLVQWKVSWLCLMNNDITV